MIISMALSPMVAIVIMNLYSFKNIVLISITLVGIGIIFLSQVKSTIKISSTSNTISKCSLKRFL